MNYMTIAGHLGSDPEVRFTSNGQKVTTFRVGCKARKDETIWWRVTIWGEQFDKMLQYFKKGSPIIAMGEIMKPGIYNDREGNPQVSLEITASNISFSPFGKSKSAEESGQKGSATMNQYSMGGGDSSPQESGNEAFQESGFSDDEIPF